MSLLSRRWLSAELSPRLPVHRPSKETQSIPNSQTHLQVLKSHSKISREHLIVNDNPRKNTLLRFLTILPTSGWHGQMVKNVRPWLWPNSKLSSFDNVFDHWLWGKLEGVVVMVRAFPQTANITSVPNTSEKSLLEERSRSRTTASHYDSGCPSDSDSEW